MSWSLSFAAEINTDCKVLVLGSMPGVKSLEASEYYAHPRNSFWSIIEVLFHIDKMSDYQRRIAKLNRLGIGLWDVYHACEREGSLDSAIIKKTSEINDFAALFENCMHLKAIALNGVAAQKAFEKNVARTLPHHIELLNLPSTSPAYAAMNFQEKLRRWQVLKNYVK